MKVSFEFDRSRAIDFLNAMEDGEPLVPGDQVDFSDERPVSDLVTLAGAAAYRLLFSLNLPRTRTIGFLNGDGSVVIEKQPAEIHERESEQCEKLLGRLLLICAGLVSATLSDGMKGKPIEGVFKGVLEVVGDEWRLLAASDLNPTGEEN
ncbi:MAG: hypothetical protein SGJ19_10380 [Planctomycetia bacterium]|nr:hypothetical protein [Planctomycetia bacterium]